MSWKLVLAFISLFSQSNDITSAHLKEPFSVKQPKPGIDYSIFQRLWWKNPLNKIFTEQLEL